MALQILENKGNFYVQGKIVGKNVKALQAHFEYVLENKEQVTININNVDEIDFEGVCALTEIYKKALLSKKDFTIVGIGSKDMYDHFRSQNIA